MAKKRNQHKGMGFAIAMVVYALVFLGATGYGLYWFWGCMEAYEASRPQKPIDSYMERISADHVLESCDDLLAQVDLNIQSQEACMQILEEALSGEFSYARKASACTEDTQVYVLKCGKQVIGSFTIEAGQKDDYGFRPWYLSHESFDLSYLMGSQTITVQAPEGYQVYVNGVQLDESYITEQERTQYDFLKDFYQDYDLPEFVLNTYEAGPFLNAEFEMEVYDPQGKAFTYDESFDKDSLIHYADTEMVQELDDFVEEFLDVYVLFSGCANDDRYGNYYKVSQYVVPGSGLAKRMLEALDGMLYAQSKGDEVAGITVHHYVQLDENTFLCDVTYLVDTTGREGVVQTTTNARILITRQSGKLLVESMMGY